jgi:hypothetical protein
LSDSSFEAVINLDWGVQKEWDILLLDRNVAFFDTCQLGNIGVEKGIH